MEKPIKAKVGLAQVKDKAAGKVKSRSTSKINSFWKHGIKGIEENLKITRAELTKKRRIRNICLFLLLSYLFIIMAIIINFIGDVDEL